MKQGWFTKGLVGALAAALLGTAVDANCRQWAAPNEMKAGVEVQGSKRFKIAESDRVIVEISTRDGRKRGQIVVPPEKSLVARVFATAEKEYLTLGMGQVAELVLEDDSTINIRQGGELIESSVDYRIRLRNTKCVRVKGTNHLLSRDEAEEKGVTIIVIAAPRKMEDRSPIDREPTIMGKIGDILTGDPEEPTVRKNPSIGDALSEPTVEGGGISGLADLSDDEPDKADKKVGSIADLASELEDKAAKIEKPSIKPKLKDTVAVTVPKEKEPDPTPSKPVALSVCHAGTDERLPLFGTVPDADFMTAGVLKDGTDIKTYSQFDSTDVFIEEETQANIPEDKVGKLLPIAQPFGNREITLADETKIIPVRLPGAGITSRSVVTTEIDADLVRFAVFSDAATLAQTGFEKLETALRKAKPETRWVVDWFEIAPSGDVLPAKQFDTFKKMMDAIDSDNSFSPLTSAQFSLLTSNIETRMKEAGQPITRAFWVIEGIRLPNTAPVDVENLITSVTKSGNVLRGPSGKERAWLDIITGQFGTKFAEYYLDGAVKTTFGASLYVEDRKGKVERSTLITNTKDIVNSLSRAVDVAKRLGASKSVKTVDDVVIEGPDAPVFNRDDVLRETGLLARNVDTNERLISVIASELLMKDILSGRSGAETSGNIDMVSLSSMRSGNDAVLPKRDLSEAALKLRLKTLGIKAVDDENYVRLGQWFEDLTEGFSRFQDRNCTHIFFPIRK